MPELEHVCDCPDHDPYRYESWQCVQDGTFTVRAYQEM